MVFKSNRDAEMSVSGLFANHIATIRVLRKQNAGKSTQRPKQPRGDPSTDLPSLRWMCVRLVIINGVGCIVNGGALGTGYSARCYCPGYWVLCSLLLRSNFPSASKTVKKSQPPSSKKVSISHATLSTALCPHACLPALRKP